MTSLNDSNESANAELSDSNPFFDLPDGMTQQQYIANLRRSAGITPEIAAKRSSVSTPAPSTFLLAHGTYETLKDQPGARYAQIGWPEIVERINAPLSKAKTDADFIIPSSYVEHDARAHDTQREKGSFGMLPIDIDKGNPIMVDVVKAIKNVLGRQVQMYIYSTASASDTENKYKWRVLTPVQQSIPGSMYTYCTMALYNALAEQGIQCDYSLTRPGQPVYLPNIPPDKRNADGAPLFYRRKVFDSEPVLSLEGTELMTEALRLRAAERDAQAEAARRSELRAKERAKRALTGQISPIERCNAKYTIAELLAKYGYAFGGGDNWRSRYQQGRTYATKDFGDYWVSMTGSDAAAGIGAKKGGYCWGDAFDLVVHYEYEGNFEAAIAAFKSEGDLPIHDTADDFEVIEDEPEEPDADPVEFTGILGEMQNQCFEYSLYPHRGIAAFTALMTFAAVVGHRTTSPTGLKLSLYGALILGTGKGKDREKDMAKRLLRDNELHGLLTNIGASRQGLHENLQKIALDAIVDYYGLATDDYKALFKQAAQIVAEGKGLPITAFAIVDEFHKVFQGIENNGYKAEMISMLLELYTEMFQVEPLTSVTRQYLPIPRPCFTLYGISTPTAMADALSGNLAAAGLVGRFMFCTIPTPPDKNHQALTKTSDGFPLIHEDFERIHTTGFGQIGWAAGGFERWIELDKEYFEPMKEGERGEMQNRIGEQVIKVATLIAISDSPKKPSVGPDDVDKAWLFLKQLNKDFFAMLKREGGIGSNTHGRCVEKVREAVKSYCVNRKKPISHTKLCENVRMFKNMKDYEQRSVITQLENEGAVETGKGKRGLSYKWLNMKWKDES